MIIERSRRRDRFKNIVKSHPVVLDGVTIIDELKYDVGNFARDAWLLLTLAIVFRIMAYAALAFRFRKANR